MRLFATFFLISLTLYGLMHFYVYRKIVRGIDATPFIRRLLRLILPILAILPFLGRTLDHDGNALLARLIDWPAYVWMAWVFWFCMAGFALDLYNLLIRLTGRVLPVALRASLPPRRALCLLAVALPAATLWGVIESYHPQTRFALLYLPHATPSAPPVRMVHVTDIHLNPLRSERWDNDLVERIRALHPDVVVSTGDLVDTSLSNIASKASAWASLKPPLGKYAVLGNHEYYAGLANSLAFHEKAGFRLLRSESAAIAPGLVLFGVDDFSGRHVDSSCFDSEAPLQSLDTPNHLTVLLKHQPVINPASVGHFDLQLSGHTHGGQVFPFQGIVKLLYGHISGITKLGGRSELLVSRGLGTWGPPFRLFAPPEIVVIDFVPKR